MVDWCGHPAEAYLEKGLPDKPLGKNFPQRKRARKVKGDFNHQKKISPGFVTLIQPTHSARILERGD